MTFRIYECDVAGKEYDAGKEFTCEGGSSYEVLMSTLKTYGFTLQSGYNIEWEYDKDFVVGRIYWRGVAWKIKRVG